MDDGSKKNENCIADDLSPMSLRPWHHRHAMSHSFLFYFLLSWRHFARTINKQSQLSLSTLFFSVSADFMLLSCKKLMPPPHWVVPLLIKIEWENCSTHLMKKRLFTATPTGFMVTMRGREWENAADNNRSRMEVNNIMFARLSGAQCKQLDNFSTHMFVSIFITNNNRKNSSGIELNIWQYENRVRNIPLSTSVHLMMHYIVDRLAL